MDDDGKVAIALQPTLFDGGRPWRHEAFWVESTKTVRYVEETMDGEIRASQGTAATIEEARWFVKNIIGALPIVPRVRRPRAPGQPVPARRSKQAVPAAPEEPPPAPRPAPPPAPWPRELMAAIPADVVEKFSLRKRLRRTRRADGSVRWTLLFEDERWGEADAIMDALGPAGAAIDALHHRGRWLSPGAGESIAGWQGLGRFDALCLDGCPLRTKGLRALFASPHLALMRDLIIPSTGVEKGALQSLAKSQALPNLECLDVSRDNPDRDKELGSAEYAILAAAPSLQGLRALAVRGWDHYGLPKLLEAPLARELRHLALSHVQMDYDFAARMEPLASGKLETLQIMGCFRCDFAMGWSNVVLPGLKGLDLAWNNIGTHALSQVLEAPFAGQLERLSLADNGVDRTCLEVLAQARMPGLAELNLSANPLADDALAALAGLPQLGQLRRLWLDVGTPPNTEDGLAAFLRRASAASLEELSLHGHVITAAVATAIAENPSLRALKLLHVSTKVDPGAARSIEESLGCEVSSSPDLRLPGWDARI
jgi:hypothetical protein